MNANLEYYKVFSYVKAGYEQFELGEQVLLKPASPGARALLKLME